MIERRGGVAAAPDVSFSVKSICLPDRDLDAIRLWLSLRGSRSPRTFESYVLQVSRFVSWLDSNKLTLVDFDHRHAEAFIEHLRFRSGREISPKTVDYVRVVLGGMMSFLRDLGHVQRNPFAAVPMMSVPGEPPRKRAKPSRHDDSEPPPANPQGRGTKRPLVLVAAERGGDVVAKVIPTHGKAAIAEALDGKLSPDAVVMTDGLPANKHIGTTQPRLSINHSDREYARTDEATGLRVHVNRVESFNGFMRRAVVGVWHQVSAKHLGRYASEATFRWNRKKDDVLDRMAHMVRTGEGRRLSYAFLTAKAA